MNALIQSYFPVVGSILVVVWLVWRLFWIIDRRAQQELAVKDLEITHLNALILSKNAEINAERTLRFNAEERASTADARQHGLVSQITDLTQQVESLRQEIVRLRNQVNGMSPGSGP